MCYGLPELEFVDEAHRVKAAPVAASPFGGPATAAVGVMSAAPPPPAPTTAATSGSLLDDPFDAFSGPSVPAPAPAPAPAAYRAPAPASAGGEIDLLGLDFGAPAPAPAPVAAPPAFSLVAGAQLDPGSFQAKWLALPAAYASCPAVVAFSSEVIVAKVVFFSCVGAMRSGTFTKPLSRPPVSAEFDSLIRSNNMNVIASGDLGTSLKIYFFGKVWTSVAVLCPTTCSLHFTSCAVLPRCTPDAQDPAGAYYLVEALVNKAPAIANVTFKSESANAAAVSGFQGYISSLLGRL